MPLRRRSETGTNPWYCLPCALAFQEVFTAPRREDRPNVPPRCPNCNRRMRLTPDAQSDSSEGKQ